MSLDARYRVIVANSCGRGKNIAMAVVAAAGLAVPHIATGAERSVKGDAELRYKFDDNIAVSNENQIALSGWIFGVGGSAHYDTDRFKSSGSLELDFERYQHASLSNPSSDNFEDPEPSKFDSDNQHLNGSLSYSWERHQLGLGIRYSRDSTLNTQFTDTGLDTREIQGTSRRTLANIAPNWLWLLTERQTLSTTLVGQIVRYTDDRYIDFDFATLNFRWAYELTERASLVVVPGTSWFRNLGQNSVRSNTYGVQVGFDWDLSEHWNFNVLGGGTQVYTVYGAGVDIPDQDSNSFTGDIDLKFKGEYVTFSTGLFSRVAPSGDGILRQNYGAQVRVGWRPIERLDLGMDTQYGLNRSTDDRIEDGREYGQAGVRLSYQFAREWWFSGSYRFREQNYENSALSTAHGNSVFLTLSYRLPKEIL